MGVLTLLKKKGAILIGPSPIFLEHWAVSKEVPLWTASCKIGEIAPYGPQLFCLYM
jgi:hypothetical protein